MDRFQIEAINTYKDIQDLEQSIIKERDNVEKIQSDFSCLVKHMSHYRCIYLSSFVAMIVVSSGLLISVLI